MHNEWGTKEESVCAPTCAYGLALETGTKTPGKKEIPPVAQSNIYWCRIKQHIAFLAKKTEQYKTDGSSKKWISSVVNNEHHTQSSPTRSLIPKTETNRKEGNMRIKEIDKMTCENKHQSMERNGKEISPQNETSLPPNERYRKNTIRTPLIPTSHSHTPTPLTSVLDLGSCSCTVTWAVGYCTTSFRTFLKRKKQRQTYIFAAKANYQKIEK